MKISEELANETTQRNLTREQKEAVGLLSIGTFLEYFDLMLYVHMAVLLNELFFPKTDPFTASLISAFSFCSTFVFRPLGALIFGYIGDTIGRKTTIIITTFLMAISCLVMANLPTYAQIGITASWIITVCRMVQGMSSMGEIVGAELYLTEMIKPPKQYFIVTMVAVVSVFGTVVALAVASLVTSFGFEWRLAFWVGAGVALIGSVARTSLRETPDFINAKREITNRLESVVDKDYNGTQKLDC
jgi:MHS family proline/betaine transporter-like MFS transporter